MDIFRVVHPSVLTRNIADKACDPDHRTGSTMQPKRSQMKVNIWSSYFAHNLTCQCYISNIYQGYLTIHMGRQNDMIICQCLGCNTWSNPEGNDINCFVSSYVLSWYKPFRYFTLHPQLSRHSNCVYLRRWKHLIMDWLWLRLMIKRLRIKLRWDETMRNGFIKHLSFGALRKHACFAGILKYV